MFINVRNNDDYEFSNLFLIVKMEEPKGKIKVSLEKNEKDKIQIIGYNVSSDALLN